MTGALGSNYTYGLTSYLSQIPGYQISTSGNLTWSVMYYTPNPSYGEQDPGSMIGKYSLLLFDMGLVSAANNGQWQAQPQMQQQIRPGGSMFKYYFAQALNVQPPPGFCDT
jgi:hypothetical protein